MSDLAPALYLDTSALVKLVLLESGSLELARIVQAPGAALASSEMAEIELIRAVRRGAPDLLDASRHLLERTVLLPMTRSIKSRAQALRPATIRALDAIHIATALEVVPGVSALVTYDRRMIKASRDLGLPVASPGIAG